MLCRPQFVSQDRFAQSKSGEQGDAAKSADGRFAKFKRLMQSLDTARVDRKTLIRIMEDLAVIHVRTSYIMPDGSRAAVTTPTYSEVRRSMSRSIHAHYAVSRQRSRNARFI